MWTSYKKDSSYNSVIIFSKFSIKTISPEVPEKYAKDYKEASAILDISPKASAAMSRRILQTILSVENGEAEWSLETLDTLFNFAFIQPATIEARNEKLNDKLIKIGKKTWSNL